MTKPVRVLHIIDQLGYGGAQVLLVNICTGSNELEKVTKHEVLVLHGEGVNTNKLHKARVRVRSLGRSKSSLPIILVRLVAHLSRRDYNILHLHLHASSLSGAFLAAFLTNAPVIVTVYALKEQLHSIEYYLFKLVDPFVKMFISLWDNSDLPSIGVHKDKITVIPIGIDFQGAAPERHAEIRHEFCVRYGISPHRPLLLSVARLSADRHIQKLVEGMICIVKQCPEAMLIMIGDGEERSNLEAMVQRHNIQGNVIFAGTRSDIWDMLPGCDIYLSSSGKCDTGVAAMQAMACGRPVVTYTIADMAEAQTLCECQGVFIQTRDPLAFAEATVALLNDKDYAQHLGQRARNQVLEQFSLKVMMHRYEQLYTTLVRNH